METSKHKRYSEAMKAKLLVSVQPEDRDTKDYSDESTTCKKPKSVAVHFKNTEQMYYSESCKHTHTKK